jgi:hypothetical protein
LGLFHFELVLVRALKFMHAICLIGGHSHHDPMLVLLMPGHLASQWPCAGGQTCPRAGRGWPTSWSWLGYALAALATAPVADHHRPRCPAVTAALLVAPLSLCPAYAATPVLLPLALFGRLRVSLSALPHCPLHIVLGDTVAASGSMSDASVPWP